MAEFGMVEGLRALGTERAESLLTTRHHRWTAIELASALRGFRQAAAARRFGYDLIPRPAAAPPGSVP